ncbi:GNAT family N-acetyltransferase [Paenibacillus sp. N1-5-1-14]|uniref:GNAT family N-acetyltransferase n=1 Tax=Paenibacillus radicibacter TaxID=2972488 RepID=UPI002158C115|nr:GNAT family N-acetyltransferase [Paenibacillus radicibacter]MCR8641267.1 GNAT family N-acetyltransferase [Paenibacillus radicibacter]
MNYRALTLEDCVKINDMNPSQFIQRAWREVDGKRQLVNIDYQDNNWPNGYKYHFKHLQETILYKGYAVGVFDERDRLIGFATLNREFFGEQYKYVLLDQLFINLEHRGKGIGKKLFAMISDEALKWGANKVFIYAGSAEETVAFYFAIGCVEAIEINKELYDNDPRDFQLEYLL